MPQQGGGTMLICPGVYHGTSKVGQAHQPSSSAESSGSPRTGFVTDSVQYGRVSVPLDVPHFLPNTTNPHISYNVPAPQQHQQLPTESFYMDAEPAIAAAPAAEDPITAIRQGLSHMDPSQLAELQAVLRQQRLQRQQQDLFPVLAAMLPAALATPSQYSLPGSTTAATAASAEHALEVMRQVAAAAAALAAANGYTPQDDAARLALLQGAAAQLLLQQQQQYNAAPADAAAFTVGQQQQQSMHLQSQQQQQQCQQRQCHPGVASCKSTRNTPRSKGSWDAALQALYADEQQQQQQVMCTSAVVDAMPGTAVDVHGISSTVQTVPVELSALLQLQQWQQAEQSYHSKVVAAPTTQRRSSRKAKRTWDISNNIIEHRSPQQDEELHVSTTLEAHASPQRAGSAEANNNSSPGGILLPQADAAADATSQPQPEQQRQVVVQQPHQPVVKRVRFALADDVASEQESDHEDDTRPKIVRRIGVRAQARKRMHKRTARRRRPMRAPLC